MILKTNVMLRLYIQIKMFMLIILTHIGENNFHLTSLKVNLYLNV